MPNIFYLPILVAIYLPFTDYRHLKLWNIDRMFSSVHIYQKQEAGNVDYSSSPHYFEEAKVLAIYIEPRFRGSIDELKKKTSVPIVFPSFIPPTSDGSRFNITVNIVSATVSSYELITGIKGCRGENVCRFCSLTGELITPETKTANQRYSENYDDCDRW